MRGHKLRVGHAPGSAPCVRSGPSARNRDGAAAELAHDCWAQSVAATRTTPLKRDTQRASTSEGQRNICATLRQRNARFMVKQEVLTAVTGADKGVPSRQGRGVRDGTPLDAPASPPKGGFCPHWRRWGWKLWSNTRKGLEAELQQARRGEGPSLVEIETQKGWGGRGAQAGKRLASGDRSRPRQDKSPSARRGDARSGLRRPILSAAGTRGCGCPAPSSCGCDASRARNLPSQMLALAGLPAPCQRCQWRPAGEQGAPACGWTRPAT